MWKAIASVALAGILTAPAWGDTSPARPGTLNYIEGVAYLGPQRLNPNSVGGTEMQAGQLLTTQDGRVEVLLTPGIFLRLDRQSAIQMDSPDIANTVLTLQKGLATVEVAQLFPDNNIVIREGGASARLMKKGVYEFDANSGQMRVFDGKAQVELGGREIDVNGGHEFALNDTKARGFDKKKFENDFYRWSSLRSSYLAEANVDAARIYHPGASSWYGPGWYWDPYFTAYTWIPGDGIFWSPFGWGFYSPFAVWGAPFYRGGFNHHFGPYYHPPVSAAFRGGASGGFRSGGMRGGFAGGMHAAGGFHGGGGHR